jgi:NAD(P)-dependent dehydrogenase (short-subunit alcohol dehydrogenase family)
MNTKLENKVVVVTGSCSGIGLAVAQKFLEEKAKVVFSDINGEGCASIIEGNENAIFIKCNVASSEEVNNLVRETVEKFGSLDVFVNNAGIATTADVTMMTDEEWQKSNRCFLWNKSCFKIYER